MTLFLLLIAAHGISFVVAVRRLNAHAEFKTVSLCWGTVAPLWRALFSGRFLKLGDRSLALAGSVHMLTSATILLTILVLVVGDLRAA